MPKLKEVAEGHPFFVLAGVFMLGVAVGAIPLTWAESRSDSEIQSKQSEIDELTSTLASLTRTVGGEKSTTIPTDEIVIAADQASSISADLVHVGAADMYYPPIDQALDWSFNESTEASLYREQGLRPNDFPPNLWEAAESIPAYYWRSLSEAQLRFDDRDLILFSTVVVQRFSYDEIIELMAGAEGGGGLRGTAESDPSGALLVNLMIIQLLGADDESGKTAFSLADVQRSEDALYGRTIVSYTDPVVNGVVEEFFFVERETILIDTGNEVVAIFTILPSFDRRNADATVVAELLVGVRVVV